MGRARIISQRAQIRARLAHPRIRFVKVQTTDARLPKGETEMILCSWCRNKPIQSDNDTLCAECRAARDEAMFEIEADKQEEGRDVEPS